ncbi:MAG: hypothetical protein ACRERE_44705 [Candidatus Entotheonellia bacterium]
MSRGKNGGREPSLAGMSMDSKGVHSDFIQLFVRRRKLVPASLAEALPSVMHLRHMADYQQPGVSQSQAERAVRRARGFVTLLQREVLDGP